MLPDCTSRSCPTRSTRCSTSLAENPLLRGYSGWAPGQLRGELDRGDWLVVDAEADAVFLKDTSKLWQDMVRRASAVRADATR